MISVNYNRGEFFRDSKEKEAGEGMEEQPIKGQQRRSSIGDRRNWSFRYSAN